MGRLAGQLREWARLVNALNGQIHADVPAAAEGRLLLGNAVELLSKSSISVLEWAGRIGQSAQVQTKESKLTEFTPLFQLGSQAATAFMKAGAPSTQQFNPFQPTVDEQRYLANTSAIDETVRKGNLDDNVAALRDAAAKVSKTGELKPIIERAGAELVKEATERGQADKDYDAQALYWARIQMQLAVKEWAGTHSVDAKGLTELLQTLDQASRVPPAQPHGTTSKPAQTGIRAAIATAVSDRTAIVA
jgi:hypothetical protein